MKGITLTTANIDQVVALLKKQQDAQPKSECEGLLLPVGYPVLSSRYRGKGRPRNSDYDFEKYDWYEIVSKISSSEEGTAYQVTYKSMEKEIKCHMCGNDDVPLKQHAEEFPLCNKCIADGWINGQEMADEIAKDPELSKGIDIA